MRALFRKLRSGLTEHGAPIFLLFLVSRSLAALSGGCISLFNPASLKAHCRLGAIIVSRAVFSVLGRWQVALCRPFPCVHVTGPRGDGPILRLAAPSPATIRVQSPSYTVKG